LSGLSSGTDGVTATKFSLRGCWTSGAGLGGSLTFTLALIRLRGSLLRAKVLVAGRTVGGRESLFLSESVGGFLSERRGKFWKAPLLSPPPRALLAELAVRENEEEGEDEDDDDDDEDDEGEEGLNTLSKLNPLNATVSEF